ncbi:alginate O-acetyltransferase [Pseudomonas cavernicola]|nr:alginate O-acetyltransferase [Pseudomonas cavernicola]
MQRSLVVKPCPAWLALYTALGLLASPLCGAAEGPQYQIERCCEVCPQTMLDSTYSGDLREFSKLVQGRGDWLFRTKNDLMTQMGTTAEGYSRLEKLRDALKKKGVELVMAYLPPRGLMNAEMLSRESQQAFDTELSKKNYLQTIQRLRSLGIRAPDMSLLLSQKADAKQALYFKRDPHWTSYGAELAAQVLAEELRKSDVFKTIPSKEFISKKDKSDLKNGSLNQAFGKVCGNSYANEYFSRFVTEPKAESADLFSDAEAPEVVLAGTSFSSPEYNFAGFLKQHAKVDVDNRSVDGGGFHSAMLQYLGSQDFQKNPPKILIWEVSSYYDMAMPLFYRQIMPMLADGCRASPASLSQKVALRPGMNEVLVNTGDKPIRGEDYLVDIQFSDPTIKNLHSLFWYMSGSVDDLNITRAPEVESDGRFVFNLREDAEWSGRTLLSLEIEMPADMPAGLEVEAKICPRAHGAKAELQAQAD